MVLLDGGSGQARDAYAVAAHFQKLRLAVVAQKRGIHGFRIFGAKVKNMTNFNATLDGQQAFTVGRGIACYDVADVGNKRGLRQVAAPVHASDVEILKVCATDPVGHGSDFAVGYQFDRFE